MPSIASRTERIAKRLADPARHLARKVHDEAVVADPPADQLGGIGQGRRERAATERSRCGSAVTSEAVAAVAELQRREQPLDILLELEVEAGKLDRHHQHPRLGLGADDMMGQPKRRHRRVAAHEADQRPLDVAAEAELGGDDLVDPGRDEAGAAGHDQMGDRRSARPISFSLPIASSASLGAASA